MEEEIKNNYASKKRERELSREKERRQTQTERTKKSFVRYGFWVLVMVAVGYGLFLLVQTAGPDGEDFSIAYNIQGRDHIADGTSHPEYNSNPPSSGWHYASTARGGFYNEPLADERVIHNMEHGDVWIAYHPDISDEAKDTLESFAGQYVVVSPRALNDGDISLVAWGRVDMFDIENGVVDEGRIKDFISQYDNRGPEKVRGVQAGHGGF
ncbi:MAG: hypothetical protein COV08_02405 [Candidatus Vogelbacteria bacterium CG10_big_fil_rev_8_21_14_0_10_49_38]|uniref:DUF3105 domain-containing protein n=1 Tax=Candidatus Vogelbacteria bacterium CG10_big_fil_rev_8_21_14_0_10_49_38 TaxID=1975043 RepID=A0A2H0RIU2_9BACT|nr:MAG: hypothetical protein BK006_02425 [bacterium CG10_49_38]PIR45944.1 MAG: hypothetical protein COV08_02405 [Candidatus Vogelbacteria bacterium CG10_big_fil_rev_8_21_14_0_10_49_38]